MRALCYVKRLEWDVPGSIFRHAIAIGDVDNDGENELVVGNTDGELYIFKGEELWQKISNLGFITCVAIGDVFNYGRNALVIIGGDGWVNIYYSPRSMNSITNNSILATNNSSGSKKSGQTIVESNAISTTTVANSFFNATSSDQNDTTCESCDFFGKMERVHVQRIPPNTKVVLIADVDNDNANEVIIGLTDRVVRSYRWSTNADLENGRLVGLNKWECASQIGTISLQHSANGTPILLVAQPGGTIMKIKCNPDDCFIDEDSESNSELAANYVDYQTLQSAQMRNPNISTEVIGDLDMFTESLELESSLSPRDDISSIESNSAEKDTEEIDEELNVKKEINENIDQVDGNLLGGNIILGEPDVVQKKKKLIFPTFKDFIVSKNRKSTSNLNSTVDDSLAKTNQDPSGLIVKPYALASLDGTIILMKDETVSWAIQVDHHLFALCPLDITGNGADEIVACAWDGQTYILDQCKNCVRFQFEEPVMAFCTGMYNVYSKKKTPCFVYKTFNNKVFLYYDVTLKSMTLEPSTRLLHMDNKFKKILEQILGDSSGKDKDKKVRELTRWILYGKDKIQ